MLDSHLKRGAHACALAVIALAAMAGSAQAAPTASSITSPATGSYFDFDSTAASGTVFTVTGTTSGGSGNVDVDCYDGSLNVYALASNVPVAGDGSFTAPISSTALADTALVSGDTCVLRAVPTGATPTAPPGSSSPFSGPTIAVGAGAASARGGSTYDYDHYVSDLSGYMDFESAGDCGLAVGNLYAPGTLAPSAASFNCVGALTDPGQQQGGGNWGGEIKVGGVEALDSDSAYAEFGALPGYQGVTLTETFDPATGSLTIHDVEPILLCVPSIAACASYVPSGVELDRTWQTADDGAVAFQTDVFRSVDGQPHSIAVLEDDSIASNGGATYQFPGASGFRDYAQNATVTLPSGPGTIAFKTDGATPDAGDGANPQGAITYASPPDGGPVDFSSSDESSAQTEFVLPYDRTIPAGGAAVLRFAYVQAYALSRVTSLAQATLDAFAPGLSISSPADGASEGSATVTVTGTASDPAGVASVMVNGQPATVGAGGTWSAQVPLAPGVNVLTALATDTEGLTAQQQVSVTFNAPAGTTAPPPPPPAPSAVTGAASALSAGGAVLQGSVNPGGATTVYEFEYGTTTALGSHTIVTPAGSVAGARTVTATVSGLQPDTVYEYRLVAANPTGPAYGAVRTFRTPKASAAGLGAGATPGADGRFPYRYHVAGRLSLPPGVTPALGCRGAVTVAVRRGAGTILTARTGIDARRCTWTLSVRLASRRDVPGHGRLQIAAAFGGNSVLEPFSAAPVTVRYG